MARITLSIPAHVYQGDPFDRARVEDVDVFSKLHGVHSNDDWCASYMDDQFVSSLQLTGGRVRFAQDAKTNTFQVTATYGIGRKPTTSELKRLWEHTSTQLSDGIGNGSFSNHAVSVCSLSLAMALLNSPDIENVRVSDFFVDAFPMGSSEIIPKIHFSSSGGPDDHLINDLKSAVQNRSGAACKALAEFYFQGKFVAPDQKQAIKLLKRGAKLKDENSIVELSLRYIHGDGVRQDTLKALSLLESGIKHGSGLAKVVLADLLLNGEPMHHSRAIQMLFEGVSMNHAAAMHRLAACYEQGQCVARDLAKALELYENAQKFGFDATNDIVRLKRQRGFFGRWF